MKIFMKLLRYSSFKIKNKQKKLNFIEEFDPSLPFVNVDKGFNYSSF